MMVVLIFLLLLFLIVVSISLFFLLDGEKAWAQTVISTVDVCASPFALEYNPSNENIYVSNAGSDDVSIIGTPEPSPPIPEEGIIGSGNNINLQVQENTGNNAIAQDGNSFSSYSDQPILQDQSTNQNSNVVG